MKYTLCITQKCNLACSYCYIGKRNESMSLETAKSIVDFIFNNTPKGEKIDIGFFGGEPFTEFELIKTITGLVKNHSSYQDYNVQFDIVSNGTFFSKDIVDFIKENNVGFCISCDGPDFLQDMHRRYADGTTCSKLVESNIRNFTQSLPVMLVNAVYTPDSYVYLPVVVEYFISLGVRQIYLNPDFSAKWSVKDTENLYNIYEKVSSIFMRQYIDNDPVFISLIDGKITVILRGGYKPEERCHMGRKEFAFTPEGNIYPCERLIGSGTGDMHCIGNIKTGVDIDKMKCSKFTQKSINNECITCGLKDYCMNNCGCSNYFSTGGYNSVGAFLCSSEKAALQVSLNAFKELENKLGPSFVEHLAGLPSLNSMRKI